jgi:hypothetical protein
MLPWPLSAHDSKVTLRWPAGQGLTASRQHRTRARPLRFGALHVGSIAGTHGGAAGVPSTTPRRPSSRRANPRETARDTMASTRRNALDPAQTHTR